MFGENPIWDSDCPCYVFSVFDTQWTVWPRRGQHVAINWPSQVQKSELPIPVKRKSQKKIPVEKNDRKNIRVYNLINYTINKW